MKTFKEILRERGINEEDQIDRVRKIAKDSEKQFKSKLKKACSLANVDFQEIKVTEGDDFYEIRVPLQQLIGPATRSFSADRWNIFFEKAGIQVNFRDNIEQALNRIDVLVPLRFDKKSFEEIA